MTKPIDIDFSKATRTVAVSSPPINEKSIEAMVVAIESYKASIIASVTKEIVQWMRAQDADPSEGWFLVMPMKRQGELPSWPDFVLFSEYIDKPMFLNRRNNLHPDLRPSHEKKKQ